MQRVLSTMKIMDYEGAKERLGRLWRRYQNTYRPSRIGEVKKSLCSLKHPEDIRKRIYTTSAAESFAAG
uniref:Uncharacterized protein n=1 Tax=Candidatus Caldatribacterium saccharofermentans TaxID=1454753 RepID=A0A7V4TXC5_9BACT